MNASHIANSGRFVTVSFVKGDGTIRTINGRTGVKRYVKGMGTAQTDGEYLLLSTRGKSGKFDQFRNIDKSSIVEIRADGVQISSNCASKYAKFI